MFNHILLEVFCLKDTDEHAEKARPEYCKSEENNPSYACLLHGCPFHAFTSCENTLCYINERSEVEEGVLFGGEMESKDDNAECLKRWKKISVEAVKAAYEEYMRQKSKQR